MNGLDRANGALIAGLEDLECENVRTVPGVGAASGSSGCEERAAEADGVAPGAILPA